MKTTDGKTKPAAKNERPVRIYREHDGKLLAVVMASSLKAALAHYYENTLRGYGWTNPKHVGNTLTVTTKMKTTQLYVALEITQQHVLNK